MFIQHPLWYTHPLMKILPFFFIIIILVVDFITWLRGSCHSFLDLISHTVLQIWNPQQFIYIALLPKSVAWTKNEDWFHYPRAFRCRVGMNWLKFLLNTRLETSRCSFKITEIIRMEVKSWFSCHALYYIDTLPICGSWNLSRFSLGLDMVKRTRDGWDMMVGGATLNSKVLPFDCVSWKLSGILTTGSVCPLRTNFDSHYVAISFNVMEHKVEFLVYFVGPECIPLLRD